MKDPLGWIREADQTLRALKGGDVDAVVVKAGRQTKIYTLKDEALFRKVRQELERRVRKRTAELSNLNKKLKDEIARRERSEEELRSNQARLHAFSAERERLMRDLHDNIIQSIYGIGLTVDECRDHLKEGRRDEASRCLEPVVPGLNSVMEAVRVHLNAGKQLLMSGKQFASSLKRLAQTPRFRFNLNLDKLAADLLTAIEATELFGIAQEAMSNSIRHAEARTRMVTLSRQDRHLLFEVTDDGVGFDPKAARTKGHGLRNIEARARNLGWRLKISSRRGAGSGITVKIPKTGGPK